MVRRLVIVSLAAAVVGPLYVTTPASATVLFTCPGIDPVSYMGFLPGLSHTQTAQDSDNNYVDFNDPCSNGRTGWIVWGDENGFTRTESLPSEPLGCPVSWGGAGPDYADQRVVLLGSDGSGPSAFSVQWTVPQNDESNGVVKVKAGPVATQYRLVFTITSGAYAPPAGKQTRVKVTVNIAPAPVVSYTCADDSDPLEYIALTSVGSVIVSQK
jgi:hypothetical protein